MQCKLDSFYSGKKILITGHTGFKGSWLLAWMMESGADVCGFSLAPSTEPNHFKLQNFSFKNHFGNINSEQAFKMVLDSFQPQIVFHLAAQSLVGYAYQNPVETVETNVLGTIKILQACRNCNSVKAFVCVTSDKVYRISDPPKNYSEEDELGGSEIYSASKSSAEILVSAFRKSFLHDSSLLVATVRAGNVIGGGDWSEDRLIPDLVRAAALGQKAIIRNPSHIRPWQHVLDALSGYLIVGQKLFEGDAAIAGAWNFGPVGEKEFSVDEIVKASAAQWKKIQLQYEGHGKQFGETRTLFIDSNKSVQQLKWKPVWSTLEGLEKTIGWYRGFYEEGKIITTQQLSEYITAARQKDLAWAS